MIYVDFEAVKFKGGKMHGGGEFALRLIKFLLKHRFEVGILNNSTSYFTEYNSNYSDVDSSVRPIYINPLYRGGTIGRSEKFYRRIYYIHGLRMLEMPYDIHAFRYCSGINKVICLIKALFFKSYYRWKEVYIISSLIKRDSEAIFAVPSLHTKYMLKALFNIDGYPTCIPPFLAENVAIEGSGSSDEKYILMLGGDRWVKNSYRFVQAYKSLKIKGLLDGVSLKVVGIPPFSNKDADAKLGISWLGYVSESDLHFYLRNCVFLAYPSLNEGFGYPAIDAIGYGKAVLCGSLASLNEVYNGKVIYADPRSVAELQSRILYILNEPPVCNNEEFQRFYRDMKIRINEGWKNFFSEIGVGNVDDR